MDHRIAMLWEWGALSFLEQLAMRSFVEAGHSVRLYSYEPVERVPEGVELADASEVLPEKAYKSLWSGARRDAFRYRLLAATDGVIWAETDMLCLKPLEPVDGYLFGFDDAGFVGAGLVCLPKDSPALARCLALTEAALDAAQLDEAECTPLGSRQLTDALRESGELERALPQRVLYPCPFEARQRLVLAGVDPAKLVSEETRTIDIHGRRLAAYLTSHSHGLPDPQSFLGQCLLQHRVDPCAAPLPDAPYPDRTHPFAKSFITAAYGSGQPLASAPVRPLDNVVGVAVLRNEGPFLLDWIAYHKGIGITDFLLYADDCSDGTEALLDALAERGIVTRGDLAPGEGRSVRAALDDAATHPLVRRADAVVVMDVDEYINIHAGDGRLSDLFAAAGDPDLISMTWRLFGTSGVVAFEDRPVAEQFTRAAPLRTRKPYDAWGLRTIFRREAPFNAFGPHRPQQPTAPMPRWTNGSGKQMPERYLDRGWRSAIDCWGYDLVTVNHYATRSCENFLVKQTYGGQDRAGQPEGIAFWNAYNRNDEEDRSILPRLSLGVEWQRAFAADPVLTQLQARSVAWHRARIETLRDAPDTAAFFQAISADPVSHDVAAPEAEAEEPLPAPVPVLDAEIFPLRKEPPATGRVAEEQFSGLMARMEKRQDRLTPLANPPDAERVVIVTSMKNEGCFILEWIAYHLSIGVTHFLVYTNDCDDPTNALLDRLQRLGIVTRKDNPFNRAAGQKPQRGALNDAAKMPVVREADWVGVIDVDEFVNIHVGDGTFKALLAATGDPNVISMTWRFFGNKGVHGYRDRWQTEEFTACAPHYIPKPRLGWGFKSFFRPDGPFGKIGVHRPLQLDEARTSEVRWVNGAGRVMPERLSTNMEWFSRKDTIGYDMVTLNHYVLRSAESFLVKRQRGRINHVDQDQGLSYWCNRNYATETDRSIQVHLPRAKAKLAELLADDVLAGLHAESVAWHEGRIAELMQADDYRALYEAITNPHLPDAIWRDRASGEDETERTAAE